jgi:two-component system, cell cycle sensor histidine kinase and response regulator CckA
MDPRDRNPSTVHRSDVLLTKILETSPQGMLVCDRRGQIVLANSRAEKLVGSGVLPSNRPGWRILDASGQPSPEHELPFAVVQRTGQPVQDVRLAVEPPDGARRLLSVSATPLFDEDGAFDGVVACIDDVTERVASENALRESVAMLQSVFRAAPIGIGVVNHRIISWTNEKFQEITGYSGDELMHQSARMVYLSDEEYEYVGREKYRQIAQRGTGTVETKWRRKDGRIIDVLLSSTPVDLTDLGRGVTFTAQDITEARVLEERLRQSEKMEAVGRLAGGIAHDFNNQLVGVMGFTDLLRSSVLDDPTLVEYADAILAAAHRAAQLTGQLLAFARKGKHLSVLVDLNHLVTEVANLLERTIDKRIVVRTELRAHPSATLGDPSQLQNAALNLALNARDAMPDGGEIVLGTTPVELSSDEASELSIPGDCRRFVALAVRDTGQGIDETLLDRIFEPFFTTKPEGRGTGMGLAAVWGTARSHGGTVRVESQLGRGTCMTLLLPVAEQLPTREQVNSVSVASELGVNQHVLVIDDEPAVLDATTTMLRRAGFQSTGCSSGQEAVTLLQLGSFRIDWVILDLMMPGLGGVATFRALRSIDPSVRVIIASGYAVEGEAQTLLSEGAVGLLQKPFRMHELVAALTR